jgi:hypothetical protein
LGRPNRQVLESGAEVATDYDATGTGEAAAAAAIQAIAGQ